MPIYKIAARRLTPGQFLDEQRLLKACLPELMARGFRTDLAKPSIERMGDGDGAIAIITQDAPPGRLSNDHSEVRPLLQALANGEAKALLRLYTLLIVEGDDRAEYLGNMEAAMPEDVIVGVDFGTQTDAHAEDMITGQKAMERELCQRALILMGVRE